MELRELESDDLQETEYFGKVIRVSLKNPFSLKVMEHDSGRLGCCTGHDDFDDLGLELCAGGV